MKSYLIEFRQNKPEILHSFIDLGMEPLRVDRMNRMDGVSYEEANKERVTGRYGKASVFFIGKAQLLKNKRSTSRPQDKNDAEKLTEETD
ncbi:MAG: hypothetical protein A2293_06275 [Elusimicrobia bacterium RIFOXYB2_FULL_49_7]|nr:MAG: hypothetical protein A2293_06275 [Elusimicrobia bacterium RIFOXYB2_FULL_49_7]